MQHNGKEEGEEQHTFQSPPLFLRTALPLSSLLTRSPAPSNAGLPVPPNRGWPEDWPGWGLFLAEYRDGSFKDDIAEQLKSDAINCGKRKLKKILKF
jgi:hypothetical protein